MNCFKIRFFIAKTDFIGMKTVVVAMKMDFVTHDDRFDYL